MTIPYTKQGAPFIDDPANAAATFNAAKANAMDQGIYEAQLQPAVRVAHNVSVAIATSTDTALAFNLERFDQAGGAASTQHDTVSNNSRLTCLYAGIYSISGTVEWAGDAAAASNRLIKIRANVSGVNAFIAESQTRCATTVAIQQSIETKFALAVNDYVELVVWHDKGSNLNVNVVGNYSPEFMMVRVA